MNYNDLLVGTVAGALGTMILFAGALNWESAYRYRPARWIEARYGRLPARIFYVLLGMILIGLAIAISQGWGLYRAQRVTTQRPSRSELRKVGRFGVEKSPDPIFLPPIFLPFASN